MILKSVLLIALVSITHPLFSAEPEGGKVEILIRFIPFSSEKVVTFSKEDVYSRDVVKKVIVDTQLLISFESVEVVKLAPTERIPCYWGLEYTINGITNRLASDKYGEQGYINFNAVRFSGPELSRFLKSIYWDLDDKTPFPEKVKYRFNGKWR